MASESKAGMCFTYKAIFILYSYSNQCIHGVSEKALPIRNSKSQEIDKI